jgi:hypothetical protein
VLYQLPKSSGTAVRDQLQDVTKIFSSSVAFAALKKASEQGIAGLKQQRMGRRPEKSKRNDVFAAD